MFVALLTIITLILAGCAGYLAVTGLAVTLSATYWQVLISASALEAAKLTVASYLYRYWKTTMWWLKGFLLIVVGGLMLITSLGIYGYLIASYQASSLSLDSTTQKVELLEREKVEKLARKQEIDRQITELPTNYVTARRQLMDTFSAELEVLNARLPEIDAEVLSLRQEILEQEAHTGPIIVIAKMLGIANERAFNYFVLLLVLVFDPTAVAMTLAANHAMKERRQQKLKAIAVQTTEEPAVPAVDTTAAMPATDSTTIVDEADTSTAEEMPSQMDQLMQMMRSVQGSMNKMTAKDDLMAQMRRQASENI